MRRLLEAGVCLVLGAALSTSVLPHLGRGGAVSAQPAAAQGTGPIGGKPGDCLVLYQKLRSESWVSITCGTVSYLFAAILKDDGYKTRQVAEGATPVAARPPAG